MGNASSADAGEVFLTITKNSAKNAVKYLEKYKASMEELEKSPSSAPLSSGGAFASTKPNHQILPNTSFQEETDLAYRLQIPPMFKDSGLISDRALDTIDRVENFIAKHILPK